MENIQNQFKDDTLIQRRQGYGYSQLNHSEGSNTKNKQDNMVVINIRTKRTK